MGLKTVFFRLTAAPLLKWFFARSRRLPAFQAAAFFLARIAAGLPRKKLLPVRSPQVKEATKNSEMWLTFC
ncbi:hypothetical protein [uncultured Desulfovibrio sp.]|uniref:hypothetical protein n=1 Tax=uncultured Desulfovibrio sp. TaxID=167968 RepID=UPI002601D0D0|nr:hypothetical protein [uncultured Desulfovibrio sp.]